MNPEDAKKLVLENLRQMKNNPDYIDVTLVAGQLVDKDGNTYNRPSWFTIKEGQAGTLHKDFLK